MTRWIRHLADLSPEKMPGLRRDHLVFPGWYARSEDLYRQVCGTATVITQHILKMAVKRREQRQSVAGWRIVAWAGRYIPVRHRHILTRSGGLRLRYSAGTLLVAGFVAAMAFGNLLPAGPAAGHFEQTRGAVMTAAYDVDAQRGVVQARLARYSDEALFAADDPDSAAAPVTPPAPQPRIETVKVGRGDTLAGVLQQAGIGPGEAYRMVKAMGDHFDPRDLRPGQVVNVRFDPEDGTDNRFRFAALTIDLDAVRAVSLTPGAEEGFESAIVEKEVVTRLYARKAEIQTSLYGSALKAQIPSPVVAQAMNIYAWDVDFQRDIRRGDKIEVMYEQIETPDGQKVKSGNVIFARLQLGAADIPVYRFEKENGDVDYYTANGKSLRKALMRTPINGARLSSGYGMRRHPVLGYNKMHKGVDFAAPTGTPIFAAGDGVVEKAQRWSSYGNYIRIRHNASLKTAYAHLHGFAKGVRVGTRVKQGQVIGYVGNTGRSTGPHLHYEVLKNNRQVNPKSIKMPQGETLAGETLTAFKRHVEALNRQYATLTRGARLAGRPGGGTVN